MTDNDFNPVVEIQAEVQVTPTLELQAEVDMGSLASERNAEAWAVGQRGGVDVSSTDQTYHNNAKYWAEQAEQTVVGSIIDDTSTALNKTWSAHKISEEFAETNGEVTDLKSALDGFTNENVERSLVSGESVKTSTGEIQTNASYSRTGYIDLKNGKTLVLAWDDPNNTGTTLNGLCFYDENNTYISGVSSPLHNNLAYESHTIPNGSKYAMYSGLTTPMGKQYATIVDVPNVIGDLVNTMPKKADIVSVFTDVEYVKQKPLLQNVIGLTKFPGNLVNIEDCKNNCYVNAVTDGKLSTNSNYFATGFIPVTAGHTYKANYGRNHAWYNSSKTYLSGATGTRIQSGITAPENAAYIRFSINKQSDGDNINSPVYLYFADSTVFDNTVTIPNLVDPETRPWCYGKAINWIGDSIVAYADFDEVVSDTLGMTETDYGINGSTVALNGDGTDGRHALCERYDDMSNDADIIAVSAGTNDFEYAWSPIGTIDDADDGTSNTTFYGALKALCRGLIEKYPHKIIFFTTPIKRMQPFESGNGGEYTADGVDTTPFSKNKYGKTLGDYADIIKEVCGYYSIPVLDMYRESLMNPHIEEQQDLFTHETSGGHDFYTHPNSTGKKIMARRVCGWLTQLAYLIDGLS